MMYPGAEISSGIGGFGDRFLQFPDRRLFGQSVVFRIPQLRLLTRCFRLPRRMILVGDRCVTLNAFCSRFPSILQQGRIRQRSLRF
jgi:hypothetical protein